MIQRLLSPSHLRTSLVVSASVAAGRAPWTLRHPTRHAHTSCRQFRKPRGIANERVSVVRLKVPRVHRTHSPEPRRCLPWLRDGGNPSQMHDAKARRARKRGIMRCPLTWTHVVSEPAVLVLWVLCRESEIGARARKPTAALPVAMVNRAGRCGARMKLWSRRNCQKEET